MKTFNVPNSKFSFDIHPSAENFIKDTNESKHWCWKGEFMALRKSERTYLLTVVEGNIFTYFVYYILNKTVSTDEIPSIEYLLKKDVKEIKSQTDIEHINRVFKTSSISSVIFRRVEPSAPPKKKENTNGNRTDFSDDELIEKFDSLENTISKTPFAAEQVPIVRNLKKQTQETNKRVQEEIQKSQQKTNEIQSKEREAYNQVKKAFDNINQLLTKLTAENVEKISIEIEKTLLMRVTWRNQLKESEKNELEEMREWLTTLRFDIQLLLDAPKRPSLYIRRQMLKSVKDKNVLSNFIKANANEVAKWYLEDLKLLENSNISQKEYALQQLKEIQKILIKNCKEVDDLQIRVQNRINYLENNNTEEAKESILDESADTIRDHFCYLFGIN